ncbi:MAG TPA: class II histone deacetylase [Steroidobacteraceae bacterium]|nr:class II histone deacetylase [Steroidobacteraceae bacterium]
MHTTGLVCHEHYFWHHTGASAGPLPYSLTLQPDLHPEQPQTKRRLLGLLEVSGLLEHLQRIKPRPATSAEILAYHTPEYVDRVRELSAGVGGDAGEFTPMGTGSYEIALLAAGGCLEGLDAVVSGKVRNVYCLVRPPGHHAERDRARGFCIFANNVLVTQRARSVHGMKRVAIVDWDVHHGNSQEHAFIEDPAVLTVSVHQDNYYPPDSGHITENGRGAGAGANINIPLPPGSGHGAHLEAWARVVVPAVRKFKPELIIVSSGFDGSAMDPLGRMQCHSETYRALARMTLDLAEQLCNGRVVMLHEGGYSTAYVPNCGLAVLEEMSGWRSGVADPFLPLFEHMGGQALQPHQAALIAEAEKLVAHVP